MSSSLLWQLACYLAYVFGQFLFLLKRAWSAKRNQTTAIVSVGDYFSESAIPIFIRLCLEGVLYFATLHYHVVLAWLVSLWGWHLPAGFDLTQFVHPILTFAAGYAIDSLVDAFSVSNKIPPFAREWLKENVPQNSYLASGAQLPKQEPTKP